MKNIFPFEYQMQSNDCGPACLKMIAGYFDRYYPIQYLRELCGHSPDGASFYDICRAAAAIGLRALAFNMSIEDLRDRGLFPVIIHWRKNHMVVIYHVDQQYAYIADPANGKLRCHYNSLKQHWYYKDDKKGAVMAIEPAAAYIW